MSAVALIFPHQLFEEHPATAGTEKVFLVEEDLFFSQYAFHKQKLVFHRASMKFYEQWLNRQGYDVEYIEQKSTWSDVHRLISNLAERGYQQINYVDPTDDWLHRRIRKSAAASSIRLVRYESPLFLNSMQEIRDFFGGRKSFRQTDFYIHQRKERGILLDPAGKPLGGKWTYDVENRKKYPRGQVPPDVPFPPDDSFYQEARKYVESHFSDHYGHVRSNIRYPVTFEASRKWLDDFLENRLAGFGLYQDSMVTGAHWLHHSLLSPLMNAGLITPTEVIERTLDHASQNEVPLNALEGFIRQILGWREFILAVYELKGRQQRTTNFWGFTRPIPESFWKGKTGLVPVDEVIKKVLDTGYAHHIERLMVLGNIMVLCGFDPDQVYRWFMELFIDAYDWVMVPNVYGMSQFADGGIMSTKPYISSSNYLTKMGDFPRGSWQKTWDGLFWRFMDKYRDFFSKNPRMRMLINTFDRMDERKQQDLLKVAEDYLKHQ